MAIAVSQGRASDSENHSSTRGLQAGQEAPFP